MQRRAQLISAGAASVVGTLLLAQPSLVSPAFTDYEVEAQPAYDLLQSGDVSGFLHALPAYGGSLVLRSPFVLLSDALGGGSDWAFRAATAPCLLAGVILAVVLFAMHSRPAAAWLTLGIVTVAPDTLRAVEFGHPEELLSAALAIGAVLAALRDRPWVAGILLGLAVANKPWALLAVGPVALALDRGHVRAALTAAASAAIVWGPALLFGGASSTRAAAGTGTLFQPWQAWWFLGDAQREVRAVTGEIKPDYRAAPAWISPITRPLILLIGVAVSAGAFMVRSRDRRDAMLVLALLLLLRCILDPWNISYYGLATVLALVAWESVHDRLPLASLVLLSLQWATFQVVPNHVGPDAQAAVYLAWSLPVATLMAFRIFAPAHWDRSWAPRDAWRTLGALRPASRQR